MTTDTQDIIKKAKDSFTGNSLTSGQFYESWAISGVIKNEIHKTGSFREKLTDYSHAFARNEKFDTLRGETIIRDIFKERYGRTMNQMREELMEREAIVRESAPDQALEHAKSVEKFIRDGETMPFYRAYDKAARKMAKAHSITESCAKQMMKEAYWQAEGRELYSDAKQIEHTYHTPTRSSESNHIQKNTKNGPTKKHPYNR